MSPSVDKANRRPKVENAIFKVHRSFLEKYSTVIKDMLNAPQSRDLQQANDENPLILTGDRVSGWEALLQSHYDRSDEH